MQRLDQVPYHKSRQCKNILIVLKYFLEYFLTRLIFNSISLNNLTEYGDQLVLCLVRPPTSLTL